jgi:hypothetical protein
MSQDEFTKLFRYMQQEFGAIHAKLEQTATKDELNHLADLVDAYAKKLDDHSQELTMLSHRVDRHEGWIGTLAVSTGTQLES